MCPIKVICAGYGRTGTTSLSEILTTLGFRCHNMEAVMLESSQSPSTFVNAYRDMKAGGMVDLESLFSGFDAVLDWPGIAFWRQLVQQYPEAKMILTVRDAEQWYDSISRTFEEWPDANTIQWPQRMHDTKRMWEVIVRDGDLSIFSDRQATVREFENHTLEVKELAASSNKSLLVLELGTDWWEPLCDFLGLERPANDHVVHANKGEHFRTRMLNLREQVLDGETES